MIITIIKTSNQDEATKDRLISITLLNFAKLEGGGGGELIMQDSESALLFIVRVLVWIDRTKKLFLFNIFFLICFLC